MDAKNPFPKEAAARDPSHVPSPHIFFNSSPLLFQAEKRKTKKTMNYSLVVASVLALAAAPSALAFQTSSSTSTSSSAAAAPTTSALKNALRDMAAYPDDTKMMSEFEAFDRNGAFSRSPQQQQQQQQQHQRQRGGRQDVMMQQGGGGGRQDMMYDQGPPPGGMMGGNPMSNPFARRGGGGGGGGRSLDGFDPHSPYGNSYGMSQSDNRRGGGDMMMGGMDYGMDYFGPPDMMMMPMGRGGGGGGGRGGGMMGGMRNGVRDTNTMGGFSYSSRVTDYAGYDDRGMMGGGGGGFDGPGGPMMMGGGGGGYDQGPMGMGGGGGMEYDHMDGFEMQRGMGGYGGGGGDYGGLGDMSRMGP